MMRDLYEVYRNTPGWWNDNLKKSFTVKDFLILIMYFELRDATGDPKAIPLLNQAATEKFTYWCAQYSDSKNCSGVSDNAIFNYIATRGAAWIRYEAFVRPMVDGSSPKPPVSYLDQPPGTDPFAYPAYKSISGVVDYMYENVGGTGSLWDWGNQAGGNLDMLNADVASATIGSAANQVEYRSPDGLLYILNPDQASYWSKYAK